MTLRTALVVSGDTAEAKRALADDPAKVEMRRQPRHLLFDKCCPRVGLQSVINRVRVNLPSTTL